MNFSIDIIDNTNKNSGAVTVTQKPPYRLSQSTKLGGFRGEQKVYNIKGSTSSKSRITIATIKIEYNSSKAEGGKRFFAKVPFLKSNNNIKLVLKSTETYSIANSDTQYRPGSYNHTYTFDVTYFNTKSIGRQDSVTASLIYNDTSIPVYRHQGVSVSGKIDKIVFGKSTLNKLGETRTITAVGYYGARIILKVNDEDGNSILNENLTDIYATTDSNGVSSNCLDITIPKGGRYSFDQIFPSIISKATAVNGSMAASGGSDNVIFDDLTGVKVGDKVILGSTAMGAVTSLSVTALNPNNNNVNECTISPRLTAADNATVLFKRSKTYDIEWYYSSTPAVVETYKLYQYRDPVLTLKGSGNSAYTITQFDGVATGLGSGAVHYHEKGYNGVANAYGNQTTAYSNIKEVFNFSYLLTASGGKNFTGFTIPIFSKTIKSEEASNLNKKSDWTNSVAAENGGTNIDITNISSTDIPDTTVTISGTVIVEKWGTKDVTMELDFDKLLTYTP